MDKKLNILIVASWYKDTANPIAGSFIEEQARMLLNRGHLVTLLYPYLKGTFISTINDRKVLIEDKMDEGLRTIRIGVPPVLPSMRKSSYKSLAKRSLRLLSKNGLTNFDLIHSHAMFMGGVVGKFIAEKVEVPLFHTEHSSGFVFNQKQYNATDNKCINDVIKFSSKAFYVSTFAKVEFEKWQGVKGNISVLHNIVHGDFFKFPLVERSKDEIRVNFVIIGSLIPRKQVDKCIKAFKNLEKDKYKLRIFGDGVEKKNLEKLIDDLGLDSNITLSGRLNREDVLKVLSNSDVLISTSEVETFGLTVAEAQAMGKPVIVFNSGGVLDIVSNETGKVINQSIEDLTKSIKVMDIKKFNPAQIRQLTAKKFSENVIYNRLIGEYKRVLKT